MRARKVPHQELPARSGRLGGVDEITTALIHARDGDPRAFERFVALSQPSLGRFCRHLGDHADIDDLTQTTYLRAIRSLHTFRCEAAATVWLFGIARRVCADAVTQRQRHRRPEPLRRPASQPNHAGPIELGQLIDDLDIDQRRAFVLTQIVGLTYDEAAAVCDCPTGTIRSRVARARHTLADQIRRSEQTG